MSSFLTLLIKFAIRNLINRKSQIENCKSFLFFFRKRNFFNVQEIQFDRS